MIVVVISDKCCYIIHKFYIHSSHEIMIFPMMKFDELLYPRMYVSQPYCTSHCSLMYALCFETQIVLMY